MFDAWYKNIDFLPQHLAKFLAKLIEKKSGVDQLPQPMESLIKDEVNAAIAEEVDSVEKKFGKVPPLLVDSAEKAVATIGIDAAAEAVDDALYFVASLFRLE